ncbi:hypothetical protein [Amphiplicatus metriothermophilus]|uniref:Chromosome partitioning ATPase, Mrp family, contains Fe-S cluster n=1 Tax=Amphiplicatus metriothermophilus TaxID=1519374 RepID=A0A239PSJ7_9PROT|nr:hypothetical protein [Amphiplicatus metriothermophilus]MBB5519195.1 Mrp family chromosome partitioning ATPase [Amphiplicatus metriothermophilus]SNT73264.1 Chromosome partitioning ATPase, Mrp family, contains Fe-S cluster [Amphiplicatus metriothermophilus]
MGVVEKAGGLFAAELAAGRPASVPREDADSGGGARPEAFDLDFEALARQGFYTPEDRSSRLSLELRAVKRRLLRRLGRAGAGRARGPARRGGGRRRNLVLVASTRAGEGKTFCAANLALSLAFEEAVPVLLVDGDAPRPKLRGLFGLAPTLGLADLLRAPTLEPDLVCLKARQAPLALMPEGEDAQEIAALLETPAGEQTFARLSAAYAAGIVVIDAPPVLAAAETLALARLVDEVVFVVEADATGAPAAGAALDELLDVNPNVSLLLNRCLIAGAASYYEAYGDYGEAGQAAGAKEGEGSER